MRIIINTFHFICFLITTISIVISFGLVWIPSPPSMHAHIHHVHSYWRCELSHTNRDSESVVLNDFSDELVWEDLLFQYSSEVNNEWTWSSRCFCFFFLSLFPERYFSSSSFIFQRSPPTSVHLLYASTIMSFLTFILCTFIQRRLGGFVFW